ncbi:alpha/beta hydrolase [Ferdinandcohnia quinoae]|uniref:Alpha/beta hydrolase-fold protein n=1 Tax=Fredinandcohnia quinoae TaxID=2918902 RepID=A0AAW5E5Y5_9BACI|nr:alpha/beta hydrolase-fold protein [Fredinandcohnia sp. SECRCQ15]MCH1626269.1 alpha/beta hydrolase-fold protein [Fredinandcohnia sp. SECRCQ15]
MSNKGTVREMTIHSKTLKEDVELIIYYPVAYSPLYKYHILITQDGRDYFNLGRIARTADQLLHNHEIENTIIVGIPYANKIDRWNKYHPDGDKHQEYIRFLGEELVPFLDQKFPTYQMGLGRVLIGDSLGATVSLLAGLEYPHTFGKVIMQSPYVNEYILKKIESFQEPHLIELYHVIGKDETEVDTTNGNIENFIKPNREMNKSIIKKGFTYFYDEFDGDHKWTYWQPDIPRALVMMLKNE